MASAMTNLQDHVALERGRLDHGILGDGEHLEPGLRNTDCRAGR
ncbi:MULTISPECIES: hypothetical protein [unclassified Mycobacterium]|nr:MULTISPECIES: hypothetical protein [unclassified Mycobacterium]